MLAAAIKHNLGHLPARVRRRRGANRRPFIVCGERSSAVALTGVVGIVWAATSIRDGAKARADEVEERLHACLVSPSRSIWERRNTCA